ncbi:MAG: hypothetical protein PHY47_28300, partial [Lachnospiraceae bacterium]|nr:hypothetical protein [Lachnospiraceae bacterium]
MDKQKIEVEVDLFEQQVSEIKKQLTNLLVIVSDGRIPDSDDMSSLDIDVKKLTEKYNLIYEMTKENVLPDELPELGSSVTKCVDAIERSKRQMLKMQIKNASITLSKFISVSSMIKEYAEALMPYQKAAKSILIKLDNDMPEELSAETEGVSVFINALEVENINNSEGISLLEKVSKFYPMQIQWGLVGKQYFYLTTETNEQFGGDRGSEHTEAEFLSQAHKTKVDFENEAVNNSLQEVAATENIDVDSFEGLKDDSLMENVQENESEVNESLGHNEYLYAINKPKSSTPSASSFRKEIIKMSKMSKEVCTILPLLTNLGVLTKEQIYLYGVCMDCFEENDKIKDNVDTCVELLSTKGYLACFEYEKGEKREIAYCLSTYCYGSMQKESISSQMKGFWALSYGNYKVCSSGETDRTVIIDAIENNSRLIEYFYGIKSFLAKEEYQIVKQSICWENNYYRVSVFDVGKEVLCHLFNPCVADSWDTDETILLVDEDDIEYVKNSDSVAVFLVFSAGRILSLSDYIHRDVTELQSEAQNSILDDLNEDSAEKEIECTSRKSDIAIKVNDQNVIETYNSELSDITPMALLNGGRTPTDYEFAEGVKSILTKTAKTKEQLTSAIVQSVLLAKGAGVVENYTDSKRISAQLRLSTNLLLDGLSYTSECLASSFENPKKDAPSLVLAAYMYAMITPAMAFDYGLKNQLEIFFEQFDTYFAELVSFKALF